MLADECMNWSGKCDNEVQSAVKESTSQDILVHGYMWSFISSEAPSCLVPDDNGNVLDIQCDTDTVGRTRLLA